MRTFHPRYVRLLNVLLFSGLGCFSYLLLALYSDLPKRDDLDFTSLGFIIGVMLAFNAMGFCIILVDSWLKRGFLFFVEKRRRVLLYYVGLVDGGCRSPVLYSLVRYTVTFTCLVGRDGDYRIDGN